MTPLIPHSFELKFSDPDGNPVDDFTAAFSEVSGLEATMEPKAIREGGHYLGEIQRVGQVTFATVILKRGITSASHLWTWFDTLAGGASAFRLNAELTHFETYMANDKPKRVARYRWKMAQALPVKFKAATFSSMATDVGIEELHFVHQGLTFEQGDAA